jgi:hypothetical protein
MRGFAMLEKITLKHYLYFLYIFSLSRGFWRGWKWECFSARVLQALLAQIRVLGGESEVTHCLEDLPRNFFTGFELSFYRWWVEWYDGLYLPPTTSRIWPENSLVAEGAESALDSQVFLHFAGVAGPECWVVSWVMGCLVGCMPTALGICPANSWVGLRVLDSLVFLSFAGCANPECWVVSWMMG